MNYCSFKQGFDEYMNLVLDDAEEVNVKKKSRKTLGMLQLSNFVPFVSITNAFF